MAASEHPDYVLMRERRERLNTRLLPYHARVTYVGGVNGGITVIWYFGKSDTGFAAGLTEDAVVERVLHHVFRGL